MTQEDKDYLFWRCKMNWHKKYHRYINEWIDNVLPIQLEYFRRERNNLIKRGIYDPRKGDNSITNAQVVSHPTVIDSDDGKCIIKSQFTAIKKGE